MRPALLLPLAALLLAACAGGGGKVASGVADKVGGLSNSLTKADTGRYYGPGTHLSSGKRLIPYTTIEGYLRYAGVTGSAAKRLITGVEESGIFIKPMSVTANDNGVYILDAGAHSLFRFRWSIDDPLHITPEHVKSEHAGLSHPEILKLRTYADIDEPNEIYATPEGDIFLADGKGKRVVRLDSRGNRLREYKSEDHLDHPVSVTMDRRGSRLFIADAFYNRVLVMNAEGEPLYAIGQSDGGSSSGSIRDMTQSVDGLLYLVNGIKREIQIYGIDGTFMRVFGEGTFSSPGGIALDDEGRTYVTDLFENRIRIYGKDGKLVETIGKRGFKPGELNAPEGLWYHDRHLFVADTGNTRVQVFKVVPESMLTGAAQPEKKP